MLTLRRELAETSDLGACGAKAIHQALRGSWPAGAVPSVRTIGRILERRGALDGRERVRRPPPPRGWYLPEVAGGEPSWTASTSSRGWSSRTARRSRSSTASRCMAAWPRSWPMAAPVTAKAVDRGVDRALAVGRPARLRPVRQRHDLPGHAPPPRRRGPGDAAVPEPRRGARVRPAAGDGLPGDDRELQRPVAGQGLGPVHARLVAPSSRAARADTWRRCVGAERTGSRRPRRDVRSRSDGG